MAKRPHVVIFNPDQWRGDVLGHVGNPGAVTPNLDRLVETDGVSFRNAFCQNTVCTPSRCSFMTGWYPHVRGHRTMFHMLHKDEPVLLKTLKDEGFFVWWGGKNDLTPGQWPMEPYCDVRYRFQDGKYVAPPEVQKQWEQRLNKEWRGDPDGDNFYSFFRGKLETDGAPFRYDSDMDNVLGACELIRNRPTDKPVCIFLPLSYPHPTYQVEDPWFSMIDRSKVPPRIPTPENWDRMPSLLKGLYERMQLESWTDEERWNELRAVYYGMCARVDHQFGMVVEALKDAGIYDDTAIFMFSDHGDFTGDYGLTEKTQNTFEDCLARVPFIVKPPASVPVQARVSDALVELIDFPATVEAVTGIEPKHTHFGRSLLPVLAGETDEHRDAVFCEGGRLHGEDACRETVKGISDNPQGIYWPRLSLQQADGPMHTKAVMCRTHQYKYVRRHYETDELYDLHTDPQELHNRIDDPAMAEVLAQLKDRMLTFFLETGDVVPHQMDRR